MYRHCSPARIPIFLQPDSFFLVSVLVTSSGMSQCSPCAVNHGTLTFIYRRTGASYIVLHQLSAPSNRRLPYLFGSGPMSMAVAERC